MPFCTTSRKSGFKCAHFANGGGGRCLVVQETTETLGVEAKHPIGRCHVVESLMRVRRVSQLKSRRGDDFAPRLHG